MLHGSFCSDGHSQLARTRPQRAVLFPISHSVCPEQITVLNVCLVLFSAMGQLLWDIPVSAYAIMQILSFGMLKVHTLLLLSRKRCLATQHSYARQAAAGG